MEVPEPRTVILSGEEGMMKKSRNGSTGKSRDSPDEKSASGFGFCLTRLCCERLVNLQISHL